MTILHKNGLEVQVPVPSIHDKESEVIVIKTRISKNGELADREHAFRVLTYIPGSLLDDKEVRLVNTLLLL